MTISIARPVVQPIIPRAVLPCGRTGWHRWILGYGMRTVVGFLVALCLAGPTTAQVKITQQGHKLVAPHYWVKAGTLSEVNSDLVTALTIYEPQALHFLWGTDERVSAKKAEEGVWRLLRKHQIHLGQNQTYTEVATGVATVAPGGFFSINLGLHLPPNPSAGPDIYHVQVIGQTRRTIDNTTTTSPGQAGGKIAAETVGDWSDPVVITYKRNPAPITQLDFPEVYRSATLVLDKIMLVDDQYGPGQEEYFIAGFIQELFRACHDDVQSCKKFSTAGRQRRFAPDPNSDIRYARELNPPASSEWGLGGYYYYEQHRWDFRLNSVEVQWPRQFVLAVSLLEEDAGDERAVWARGIDELGEEILEGHLLDLAENELEGFFEEHAFDAIRYVADGVRTLVSVVSEGAAGPVIGTAIAIATHVAVSIIEDMADDYYGTKMSTLTLISNRVEEVHKLPGRVAGQTYVLDTQRLRFTGPPPANAAAAFDGIVDITFHWEFSDREVE